MTDIPPNPAAPAPVTDAKSVLASRTVIASCVAIAATVAQHFGQTIAAPDQSALVDAVAGVFQYGGMAAAVVFRILATKPLK